VSGKAFGGKVEMTQTTTDSSFRKDVLESEVPVLVDFWAPWCGPCQLLGPLMDDVSREIGDKARVVKINVDENPMTASYFGIRGIPTVMLFNQGKLEQKFVGVYPKSAYLNALNN
jgi:thioredoxin 1